MWILQWLPDWIFYLILLAGIIGLVLTYFAKFIPFVSTYTFPVRIGSYVALVVGLYMSGAIHDNNAWLDRVHEMEDKVAKAEQESKEANEKLNQATKTNLDKIKEKKIYIKEYIDREVSKYDAQCIIPKEFVNVHNQAADDVRK